MQSARNSGGPANLRLSGLLDSSARKRQRINMYGAESPQTATTGRTNPRPQNLFSVLPASSQLAPQQQQQQQQPLQEAKQPIPPPVAELKQPAAPPPQQADRPQELKQNAMPADEQHALLTSIWTVFQPDRKRPSGEHMFSTNEDKLQYALSFYHTYQPRLPDQKAVALFAPFLVGQFRNNRQDIEPAAIMQWLRSAKDPGFPDFVPWINEQFRVAVVRYLRFRAEFQRYHVTMGNLVELWKAHAPGEVDPANKKKAAFEQSLRRFMKKHKLKIQDSRSLKRKGMSKFFASPQRQAQLLKYFTDNPKATLDRAMAHFNSPNLSKSALYREMRALGLAHQQARYIDPRAQPYRDAAGNLVNAATHNAQDITKAQLRRREITTQERYEFAQKQREAGNVLNDPTKLLFMDETTLQLNMQQKKAWGADSVAPILPHQKGPTPQTIQLMLIIGVTPTNVPADKALVIYDTKITKEDLLDNELVTDNEERFIKKYADGDPLLNARVPVKQVLIGKTVRPLTSAGLERLQDRSLKQTLQQLGVSPFFAGNIKAEIGREQMIQRLLYIAEHGRVGLPIALDLREKTQAADKVTSNEVAAFLRNNVRQKWQSLEFPRQDLTKRVLVWDNARSHDAPLATSQGRRSWFHDHIGSICGIQSVVFTPQYTPGKNPTEAAFAYIKRDVRANCPDKGAYTTTEMIKQIQKSIQKITPAMIRHWVRGCGYGRKHSKNDQAAAANVCDPTTLRRQEHTVECAVVDADGKQLTAPVMKQYAHNNKRKKYVEGDPRTAKPISKWRFIDKPAALRAFAQSQQPNATTRLADVSAAGALLKKRKALHYETLAKVQALAAIEEKTHKLDRRWVGVIRPPLNDLQASAAPPAMELKSKNEKAMWHQKYKDGSWRVYHNELRNPPLIPSQIAQKEKEEAEKKAQKQKHDEEVAKLQPKEPLKGTIIQYQRTPEAEWYKLRIPGNRKTRWLTADHFPPAQIAAFHAQNKQLLQNGSRLPANAAQPRRKRK